MHAADWVYSRQWWEILSVAGSSNSSSPIQMSHLKMNVAHFYVQFLKFNNMKMHFDFQLLPNIYIINHFCCALSCRPHEMCKMCPVETHLVALAKIKIQPNTPFDIQLLWATSLRMHLNANHHVHHTHAATCICVRALENVCASNIYMEQHLMADRVRLSPKCTTLINTNRRSSSQANQPTFDIVLTANATNISKCIT